MSARRNYAFAGQQVAVRTGAGLGGVTSLVCDTQGTPVAAVPNTTWSASSVTRIYTDPFGVDRTPGGARGGVVEDEEGAAVASGGLPGDRRFLGAAGGVEDTATGLTLLGARFYDPVLGRFLSVDPELDPGKPAQFNAYLYAGQNPVTFSDPTGYGWGSFIKKAASKTAGFVKKHQAEIAGAVAGAVVFGGCMVATAGAGSIGCGIAAGAVYGAVSNLWKTTVQKKEKFSWSGLARDTVIGGASSAVGGPLVGKVLSKVAPRVALAAQAAFQRAQQATIARAQNAAAAAAAATKQRISNAVTNAALSVRSGATSAGSSTVASSNGSSGALRAAMGEADTVFKIRPGKARGAVAEGIQTASGRRYSAASARGESPDLHEGVRDVLDAIPESSRGDGHGRCGLAICLSDALRAGDDPTGADAAAVLVRGSAGHSMHGRPVGPCSSCVHLVSAFKLVFVTG